MNNSNEYYIQNGYVGNAILWWALDSAGYTTNITEAQRYSFEEMKDIVRQREQDIGWPCDYIDDNLIAHKTIIDMQYLKSSNSVNY